MNRKKIIIFSGSAIKNKNPTSTVISTLLIKLLLLIINNNTQKPAHPD